MQVTVTGIVTQKFVTNKGRWQMKFAEELPNGEVSVISLSAGDLDLSKVPTLKPVQLEMVIKGNEFKGSHYLSLIDLKAKAI